MNIINRNIRLLLVCSILSAFFLAALLPATVFSATDFIEFHEVVYPEAEKYGTETYKLLYSIRPHFSNP